GPEKTTKSSTEPTVTPASLRHPDEVHLANIVQLTRDADENAEAYWSPDGKQLIFQSSRAPYGCDQIYTMPALEQSEPKLVSTGKGRTTCAYFTHDQQRIIYSSTHEANSACPPKPDMSQGYVWPIYAGYEIYSAKPDGSDLVNLSNSPGYDAEATVCPVDGSIIFTSTRDGDLELYRMDADGKNVKRLTSTPGYDGGAFFSADCKQIVWRASRPTGDALADYQRLLGKGLVRPSKLEVFVANADGSDARQVTYLGAASFGPYLHPDGKRILFSTNHPNPRGREFDIWAIDTDGTNLERITHAPGFDGFPMFSPDGKKLAFGSNRGQAKDGQTDVYVADWIEGLPAKQEQLAADRIKTDIDWLADDAREGRGVGTEGIDQAAEWIAEHFEAAGLEPAAGGAFLQTLEVPISVKAGPKTALVVNGKAVPSNAFRPASISSSAAIRGQTAFVGYGIVDAKLGIDDYRGKSVKGRIAVVQRFVPKSKVFQDEKVSRRLSDMHFKAFLARERGAIGVIFVDRAGAKSKDEADLPALGLARQGNVGIPVVIAKHDPALVARRGARVAVEVELVKEMRKTHNVVGVRRGKGTGESVVIGAHYDHLGYGDESSLEPGVRAVHNGADDNASGTAVLIEIARQLEQTGGRDVYFIAFTAEELGLLGARHFVTSPPPGFKLGKVAAMINMDMVGRMRRNQVSVLGGATAPEWKALVQKTCDESGIQCSIGGSGYGPSDQTAFYGEGIPVLHFFTGAHGDYHKTTDDSDRINAAGAARIAKAITSLAIMTTQPGQKLSYQRIPAPLPVGDARSWGASLGTIPDYADAGKGGGMRLAGVRPGGPAEKAGLMKGDVLIGLGPRDIKTVRDLVYVLRDAKPGQRVKATVVRGGKKLVLPVTFGKSKRRPRGR
ncbi:MAG: M20/M25/M40 family metallo-hydrolase, partial [Deltaproteobacteria bacterium]|nr:M20/M25/M40 family metallo-hydrolase [Deltaproteobacteria bacterium]